MTKEQIEMMDNDAEVLALHEAQNTLRDFLRHSDQIVKDREDINSEIAKIICRINDVRVSLIQESLMTVYRSNV